MKTNNVVDYYNYSADTLTLINNTIYFANGGDGNHLAALTLEDKSIKKLTITIFIILYPLVILYFFKSTR